MSLPPIIQPASPRSQDPLPQPAPEAQAHSQLLCEKIVSTIHQSGGWIPFPQYMEMALYAPALGYYSGGARKFGSAGDFVTAPEMTPLFGQTLARSIAPILANTAPSLPKPAPVPANSRAIYYRHWKPLASCPNAITSSSSRPNWPNDNGHTCKPLYRTS